MVTILNCLTEGKILRINDADITQVVSFHRNPPKIQFSFSILTFSFIHLTRAKRDKEGRKAADARRNADERMEPWQDGTMEGGRQAARKNCLQKSSGVRARGEGLGGK